MKYIFKTAQKSTIWKGMFFKCKVMEIVAKRLLNSNIGLAAHFVNCNM